jgi:flagellar hook capping protein FlgD
LSRIPAAVLVVCLLGGTAAAFAVTQGLKQTQSPILSTRVTKVFSPVCRCPTDRAKVTFRLRHADHLTLSIENADGRAVRLLFQSRPTAAGLHTYTWDGGLDGGALAPDGKYKPRLELDDADRVIVLPNLIAVDTRPPQIVALGALVGPRLVVVRYRVSEPAHGLLYVRGHRVVKTYRAPLIGTLRISRSDLRARGLSGQLALQAEDRAGNRSPVRVLSQRVPR